MSSMAALSWVHLSELLFTYRDAGTQLRMVRAGIVVLDPEGLGVEANLFLGTGFFGEVGRVEVVGDVSQFIEAAHLERETVFFYVVAPEVVALYEEWGLAACDAVIPVDDVRQIELVELCNSGDVLRPLDARGLLHSSPQSVRMPVDTRQHVLRALWM